MQKPPFRRRELNENVLIGLAFHKRKIWLHAIVTVLFLPHFLPTRIRWVRLERKQTGNLCWEGFKRVGVFFIMETDVVSFQTYWLVFRFQLKCIKKNPPQQKNPYMPIVAYIQYIANCPQTTNIGTVTKFLVYSQANWAKLPLSLLLTSILPTVSHNIDTDFSHVLIWSPCGVQLHHGMIWIKPSTALQCYWTNQPYQLLESGALPNYNRSGSQDADECGVITVQSHGQHSHSSHWTHRPGPLILLRESFWDADEVDFKCLYLLFFLLQWLMYTPSLSLPSLLIKTDPPAGHTRAKLIILEMGYMSILWW